MSLTTGPGPCSPRQRHFWQTAERCFAALTMEGWRVEGGWLWSHSDSPLQSPDTNTVPYKPVEQNRHCFSSLHSAWLLSTESPSRSVTINLLQYRPATPPQSASACSPTNTDTMATPNLCSPIAHILTMRAGMSGQCKGSPSVPGYYKVMCRRAYGRAEVQLHWLLASALDRFVPETACSLMEATGTKIQFKEFWKDKMALVRQKMKPVHFPRNVVSRHKQLTMFCVRVTTTKVDLPVWHNSV